MFASELTIFAARFNVAVSDTYVLPALFERTAQMANMSVRGMIAEATYRNNELGEYLAQCARKIAAQDRNGS